MRDIARDLNVSAITVSKALRNHKDISEATRERVLQRMREVNYEPNLAARSLATGKSYMVGLVVPDLVHPFFGEIAKAISRVLRPAGYSLVIASSEEESKLERAEVEAMLARPVDALLLASALTSRRGGMFQKIADREVPLVMLDRVVSGVNAEFVGVDDEELGFIATRHLIERGCQRIAHIEGPEISTGVGRLRGYRRALEQFKIKLRPELQIQIPSGDDRGVESGYHAMQKILAMKNTPDGVFCFNDECATGALRATLDAGVRVPQDMALVGVGNMRNTDFLKVALTTIDQNSSEIGERAARVVLSLMEKKGEAPAPCSTLVPVRLIERESTNR